MWVSLRRRRTRSEGEAGHGERGEGEHPADPYVLRSERAEAASEDIHETPPEFQGHSGERHDG